MEALRIYVADDHSVVVAGVRAILQRAHPPMKVVATADSGEALLGLLEGGRCDVLVTDFAMPQRQGRGQDGLRMLQSLRRDYPQLRIVVLTVIDNPSILRAMLELGVHGLVGKISAMEDLAHAIAAVNAGRGYVSADLQAKLDTDADMPTLAGLSAREAEVVRLFADGMSVSEIAQRLHRSVKTISHQKTDAMRKLGIENHSQLYAYARDHGLKP
ncbi:response regulator transcription factor [Luteimonas sp. SX5]|uniref:Response regulator transcription factor n=1 Tax=Luteimonas galliterrae TaxID=2940486 RepID=A0ABT0ME18_9GAMM|nr:response regulator transcription factor [Luteimonas galliterrae]MCL1633116.1 response regulator transcription factor [Luteimonas galliterrae]